MYVGGRKRTGKYYSYQQHVPRMPADLSPTRTCAYYVYIKILAERIHLRMYVHTLEIHMRSGIYTYVYL